MRVILSSISTLILCSSFLVTPAPAAPDEWYTYRYNSARTGAQPYASDLSDPAKVGTLEVQWGFPPTPNGVGQFKASPIVVDDTVFIGSVNGYFYALDAATGTKKWQYPKDGDQALLGSCDPNGFAGGIGHYGIPSSATFAVIRGQRAIIFGAPDPTAEGGLGSARLFALPLSADPSNPQPIWQSDIVAHVNGCTGGNQQELHERIAYSSPLVFGDKVYVGVHDTGDSPIQQGRVVAVDVNNGKITGFTFLGAGKQLGDGSHGGGVWNALATDGTAVYFTTGNSHDPWCSYPYYGNNCLPNAAPPGFEPPNNNGLSMIRVDKDTGIIRWKYQPVPFGLDGDPDWAAGATVMSTSCGELIASVQKDGWSYAIDAERGPLLPPTTPVQCPAPPSPTGAGLSSPSWQFPPTTNGAQFTDCTQQHGDDDYRRPGAAWNDVFIVRTGGEANTDDSPCLCEHNDPKCTQGNIACRGYFELHALNACATSEQDRVRWIADIRNNISPDGHISYSTPTVTGGIVFIGTNTDPIDLRGHLVVLADPSVVPAVDSRCSNIDFQAGPSCTNAGFANVPIPKQLASIAMPDGGSLASMRNEPVLARGRVFVATSAGHVYMLEPEKDIATIIPAILAPADMVTITIEAN